MENLMWVAVEQWGILCGRRLFCAGLNDLDVDLFV